MKEIHCILRISPFVPYVLWQPDCKDNPEVFFPHLFPAAVASVDRLPKS